MWSLLQWLDANPVRHWTLAWTLFTLLVAATLTPLWRELRQAADQKRWRSVFEHPLTFIALLLLTLAAFRWPTWFNSQYGNPDEAQMIAGAITLSKYPVFWQSVDGTTHGPHCDYVVLLPKLVGLPINFVSARIVALMLEAGALLCLWRALCHYAPETIARLGILPGAAFWSFADYLDFLQYSSELVSIALSSAACWSLAAASTKPANRRESLFVTGLLAGAIPFAKLQGTPLTLTLLVVSVALILRARLSAVRHRVTELLALGAGFAILPCFVLLFVVANGLFTDFWTAYVVDNLAYAGARQHTFAEMLRALFLFNWGSSIFTPLFAGCLLAAAVFLIPAMRDWQKSGGFLLTVWLLFMGSILTTISPGRQFTHYLQFLIIPTCLLATAHLAIWQQSRTSAAIMSRLVPPALFLVLAVAPVCVACAKNGNWLLGRLKINLATQLSPTSLRILRDARPDDQMATWGWIPRYYVETGLPQGTREAHTQHQLTPGPMQDYFRNRYLSDFQRSQPRWFLDTVGNENSIYTDRATHGHETFPELNAMIVADYRLVAEIDGNRIYRRKDGS